MQEIELKFQIPEAALAAVAARLHQLAGGQEADITLRAAYFDTPARLLGAARMALRVRQEGPDWVQTLKAGGSNTMMRLEDNQPAQAPEAGQAIHADLSHHSGNARDALMHTLGWQPEADPTGAHTGLVELYRTDITRTRVQVCVAQGTAHEGLVELALDLGTIHAGALSVPVRELEIESVSGHPMAVIDAGREWVAQCGLWLDTQTKAHRGDRLARQAASPGMATAAALTAQATLAQPARIKPGASAQEAWRAHIESCLAHLSANLSELASLAAPDHQAAAAQLHLALQSVSALPLMPDDGTQPLRTAANQFLQQARAGAAELSAQWDEASAIALARSEQATRVCLDLLAALL